MGIGMLAIQVGGAPITFRRFVEAAELIKAITHIVEGVRILRRRLHRLLMCSQRILVFA